MNIKMQNILINNNKLYETYNSYSNVFNGTKTYKDATYMLDILKLNKEEKNIFINIINNKKFQSKLDFQTMEQGLKEVKNSKYREDANIKVNNIIRNTIDIAQIKALTRVANTLPLKPINTHYNENTNKIHKIKKMCPHCKKEITMPANTEYIICGYGEQSYDWEGCCHDWCFQCGKILCKIWEDDQLFIPFNQIHDRECCKKHSLQHKNKYPHDYCQCKNDHIKRDIVVDIFK
jgi:hypothetical protein